MATQTPDAGEAVYDGSIKPFHAEQLRWALSTQVGIANADVDPESEGGPRSVTVTVEEIAKSTPFGAPKCRALLDQLAETLTSGVEKQANGTYVVDPST